MNCSNCGAPLTPGSMACSHCGVKFSTPVPGAYPPARNNKVPVWAWVVAGCGGLGCLPMIAILAAILFPVFAKARGEARKIGCLSNEKQMALAMLQYTNDYDQHLPPAGTWMDAIHPYTEKDFACPDVTPPSPITFGYAYNSNIGNKKATKFESPGAVVVFYDSTNLSRNATDPLTSIPSPGRHEGGNNFAYLDGHAVWINFPSGT